MDMEMAKAIIKRVPGGELSTVMLPDGAIETCFFGDDGRSEVIARYYPQSVRAIADVHYHDYMNR